MKKHATLYAILILTCIVCIAIFGCKSYATAPITDEPTTDTSVSDSVTTLDQDSIKEIIKGLITSQAEETRNEKSYDTKHRTDATKPTKTAEKETADFNTDSTETSEQKHSESEEVPPQPVETPELAPPPTVVPTQPAVPDPVPATEATDVAAEPTTEPTTEPVVSEPTYPMYYSDDTANITIDRYWTGTAFVYTAHVIISDYTRAGMYCANNTWGGYCTTSQAASQLGAIFCVNGDYNPPSIAYKCARQGVCYNDGPCYAEGLYNSNNGMLFYGGEKSPTAGQQLSTLVANGQATDTMQFGPAFLRDGQVYASEGGTRRPRTFIGTNGNPGDFLICVADGDLNDGQSYGLTGYECAEFLRSHGCIFGVPLDGGGSSTFVFQGVVLNAVQGKERAVCDFFFIR